MRRMQAERSQAPSSSSIEPDQSTSSSSNESYEPIAVGCSLADLSPGGKLSLVSISLEAFVLGNLMSLGLVSTFYWSFISPSQLWRPPLFVSVLTFFHFCEFYTYARWNTKNATAESYLTLSNGKPYIAAMAFAFVETVVTSVFFQTWHEKWAYPLIQIIGLLLLVVGQFARHAAIATAGTSFNHHIQSTLKDDHVLITRGIYHYLRHPSYFGFYWWAVGTQLLLGNIISTPLFALILWRFFFRRIPVEEKSLIKMFGENYIQFRQNTPIGIPFMGYAVESVLKKSRNTTSR